MPERSDEAPPRRPGRWPLGLIGMLALVVAVESTIADRDLDLLTGFQWDWNLAGRRVASPEVVGADLLAFGDSQMKLGFVPQVAERRLGRSAYNLALVGGQAPASYFLLRRALDAGAAPDALIVDYFPGFLRSSYRNAMPLYPQLLNLRDCLDLGLTVGDPELLGQLVAEHLLPSARDRLGLRQAITLRLEGRPASQRYGLARLFRNWRVNRGAQLEASRPDLFFLPDSWAATYFGDTKFNYVNLIYIGRFLRLAAAHGLPVYWVVPPVRTELQAACGRSGFDAAYNDFFDRILDRYPNVVLVDGRAASYGPDVFMDPHHLGLEGAFALTNGLCDLLASGPPASRRLALPPYVARPIDPPLEDVGRSHAIALGQLNEAADRR